MDCSGQESDGLQNVGIVDWQSLLHGEVVITSSGIGRVQRCDQRAFYSKP